MAQRHQYIFRGGFARVARCVVRAVAGRLAVSDWTRSGCMECEEEVKCGLVTTKDKLFTRKKAKRGFFFFFFFFNF